GTTAPSSRGVSVCVVAGARVQVTLAPAPAPRALEPVAVPATSTPSSRPSPVPPAAPAGQHVRSSDVRSSPLVRRIARENHIDLAGVPGTGLGGRISKNDILSFVQQHGPAAAGAVAAATTLAPPP